MKKQPGEILCSHIEKACDSGTSLLQHAFSCSLAMIITDVHATIINLNDAFVRMLGYEAKQELSAAICRISVPPPARISVPPRTR